MPTTTTKDAARGVAPTPNWRKGSRPGFIIGDTGDNTTTVASFYPRAVTGNPAAAHAEMLANTDLAISSRELLDALKACQSAMSKMDAFLEDLRKSNPGWLGKLVLQDYAVMNEAFYEGERALPKANAAIARAEGRQP